MADWYAIVFTRDFAPGEHWRADAPAHDTDRRQHWKKGELYSIGSVVDHAVLAKQGMKAVKIPAEHLREDGLGVDADAFEWDEQAESFRARG